MKRNVFIILLTLISSIGFSQQEQETIMTINGQEISGEEFLRVYNKNNNITPETEKKGIDNYLDLFINYKLKVIEAENLGYDTAKSFIDEFGGYREQLAKPYLESSSLKDELVREAYERSTQEINASHILIICDKNAIPEDTLKAYNKLSSIRARVVGGEPFEDVAKATSDDPSVKKNSGNLGYFSVFKMIYPFETEAYNTNIGEISKIIRTSFGYHIIKVNDKRLSRGSIKVAHIMTRILENASALEIKASKDKIDKAYLALMNGMTWNDAVQEFSENMRTKANKGEVGWLQDGQAPSEFLDPCYEIEIGKFTKPIEVRGGFHIGFVIEKKPIESFEESQEKITRQVDRDENRKQVLEGLKYSQLKSRYTVVTSPENNNALYNLVDSSIYTKKWNASKASELAAPILKIEDKIYTQYDFAKYLASDEVKITPSIPIELIIAENFNNFVNESLHDYAMLILPEENPDYKHLLKEYHDGILLFNLTNDLVWEKAQKDTLGLEAYYKQAEKYQWNERVFVNVYKYTDNSFTIELPALVKKQVKKKLGADYLQQSLCANDSIPCISFEEKIFEKGQDSMADKLTWEKGTYIVDSDQEANYLYYVVDANGKKDKVLKEARGLYVADYQNFLETQWVSELRAKYEVVLNEGMIEKIKSELTK